MDILMGIYVLLGILTSGECQNVRLVGGPPEAPNVGRVEISIDGLWHEVCYRGDNTTSDRVWNIQNVMVTCRQMGYPGAGLAEGEDGRFGNGGLGRSVDNFQCNGDENNILQCSYDEPRDVSCASGDTAYATCAVPGYLGCFVDQLPRAMPYGELEDPEEMSITKCIDHCRNLVHGNGVPRYAAVQDGRQCFCGMNGAEYDVHGKAPEEDCSVLECPGDVNQACGSIWKMAVYDLTKGNCSEDTLVPENGFRNVSDSYPRFGSTVLFECMTGFVLIGQYITQCVLGSQADEVTWNGEEPICVDERFITTTLPSSTTQDNGKQPVLEKENGEGTNLLAILLGALGFAFLIFILVAILLFICFITRGRKKTRHRQSVNPKTTEESRVNRGYTDDDNNHDNTASNGQQNHSVRAVDTEDPIHRGRSNSVVGNGSTNKGLNANHSEVDAMDDYYREIPAEDNKGASPGHASFQTVSRNYSTKRKQSDPKESDDNESLCMDLAPVTAQDHSDDHDHGKGHGIDETDGVMTESSHNELSSGYTSDYQGKRDNDDDGISGETVDRKEAAILVTRT